MSVNDNTVHEMSVEFTDTSDLEKVIKVLKTDLRISLTTSIKKFSSTPPKYDFWYSKTKKSMKISNKNGKIHDHVSKLLKIYDRVI